MKVLEGLPLSFQKREIEAQIRESRIQKVVHHPPRQETWLDLYTPRGRQFLVLSCHPEVSLCFLVPGQNVALPRGQATSWTQILHKYLVGGKILSIAQEGWDRILRLEIKNPALWQEENEVYLFIELTGRNANCILTWKNVPHTILGAYRKIPPEKNRFRTILPGHPYVLPPQKEKINPLAIMAGEERITLPPKNEAFKQWIIDHIDGIGPFLATIIARGMTSQENDLTTILSQLFGPLQETPPPLFIFAPTPCGPPQGIFWQNPLYLPEGVYQPCSSWNEALQLFYRSWWEYQEKEARERARHKKIQEELAFLDEEIQRLRDLLQDDENLEEMRTRGELLKLGPSLEVLEETSTSIRVKNPFTGGETFIPLDPSLTRVQNMQRYFRLYRKAVHRNAKIREKLSDLEKRKEKIRQEVPAMEEVSLTEFVPSSSTPFRKFKTSQGSTILVGKSQKSNQELLQSAARDDYWLHARDLPGAHVILKLSHESHKEEEIEKAAQLAGYFSAGKNDTKVEVIVTQVKNVHPVPKTLGKVTFRNEKTILVKPTWPKDVTMEND